MPALGGATAHGQRLAPRRCRRKRARAGLHPLLQTARPPAPTPLAAISSPALPSLSSVNFGEQLVVVGSHEALGAWDLGRGLAMTWHEGDVWQASARWRPAAALLAGGGRPARSAACFKSPAGQAADRPSDYRLKNCRPAPPRCRPQARVSLPAGSTCEFKFVLAGPQG